MLLELKSYSDLSQHIKEPQNSICLNFLKTKSESWDIPKVTGSVLSVCTLSVFSLRNVFFTAWEHDVWRERHGLNNSNDGGRVFAKGQLAQALYFFLELIDRRPQWSELELNIAKMIHK